MKYTPRTTAPSSTNKNYLHYAKSKIGGYNYCIHIADGSCLPNCVGYAWGRWREMLGKFHNLPRVNAENWYSANDGYERGQTPKLGAVICWRKGQAYNESDGAGHVGIVEKINADGSILVSNSAYKGKRFYTMTLKPPYNIGTSYVFQGFIYFPETLESTEKTETVNPKNSFLPSRGYFKKGDVSENVGKVAEFMYRVFPAYTDKRALGNSYGQYIISAITEFQKRTGLEADGCIGPITLKELTKYGFKY